ncbi:response regulator transcription factor [Cyclobacterium qasimii]|uniref:Phosphate regulon transcriptional regulatory protein PhoB n=2 Tax=Cyclobacterium qasimii TaxID=1350429 RepID=S7VH70_9BACT|nr:response regulator transcription factor [Cyclobacterium qasimii]EPR69570.1 Phosphate regulon transcriptional regulatory protein PhoB (SphR) [Cyclobacterium qasimii M12-11B]GEO21414.1 DNA-binding response regulator [Cyclobacterium qasimii]
MGDKKILLIEDDKDIAELVVLHLNNVGYAVESVNTFAKGMDCALNNQYQLILLDLMLPDGDGLDICRNLRMEKIQTPIVMLTAKTEEIDKVLGLESGADDYIGKPFSIREFIARVKAIIRRSAISIIENETEVFQFDNLTINIFKRKVTLDDKILELTKKEFELLYFLAKNKGVTYSREKLLNIIWGYEYAGYDHTVNSHINRLRAKIEDSPNKPKFILTAWGVGYKFNDEI